MTTHTKGEAIARLLFIVFAHVADCSKRIEPQDIEQLNQLLADTGWTRNAYLRAGLESLRDDYSALWTDYESGKLVVSLEAARLRMAVAMIGMNPEHAAAFKQGLLEFTRRALPVGPGALSLLGLAGSAERRRARKEVDELLSAGPDAVAAPAAAAPSPSTAWPAAREAVEAPAEPAPAGAAASDAGAPGPAARAPAPAAAVAAEAAPAPARATGPDWAAATDWTGGRIQAVCVRVTDETHDARTYTFVADPVRMFRYRPGQFVTVDLSIDGVSCKRSYTLSSSPSRPHTLSITVKRVPGGLASNWLYEHMRPGMSLRLNGPYGSFSCLDHPARKLLLVSGGSGVTPMMSMLRWFGDTAADADIVFVNNVRSPADVIFEHELAYLGTRLGGALKLAVVPSAHAPCRPWNGPVGRLDRALLLALAPDFMERETFVCGPGPYMEAVRAVLLELGYPMQRFHVESFGGPTVAPARPPVPAAVTAAPPQPLEVAPPAPPMPPARAWAPAAGPAPAPGTTGAAAQAATPPLSLVAPARAAAAASMRSQIVFQDRGLTVDCEEDETLLEAAERWNVALEAACRSGRCGTCRLKKVSGEVVMDGQEALTDSDIESGYVLACVGRPAGRVVLQA